MAINGKVSIFRFTETTNTETSITDKVEFDGNAAVPDGRSGIRSYNINTSRTQTQVSAPFQETARKPDTGFNGTRYILNVFFDESIAAALAIARIRTWSEEPNSVKGKFKNGRFGIRNEYRPEFNLTPDNTEGYKLVSFEINHDLAYAGIIPGTIILEYSGDRS